MACLRFTKVQEESVRSRSIGVGGAMSSDSLKWRHALNGIGAGLSSNHPPSIVFKSRQRSQLSCLKLSTVKSRKV